MHLTQLIPFQELSSGQIGAIRNQVTKGLLALAAAQLKMPVDNLVVRDIRPQADLDWGSTANFGSVSTDIWTTTTATTGYVAALSTTTMADQRFVAIYGLRDARYNAATIREQTTTLWKFDVGHSVKAIWDISKCYAYKTMVVGISPSAVVIPQNAYFQIYGYEIASALTYVSLEGIVVEPRGRVVSP